MYFERQILIECPVERVFGFLRDKHTHTQAPGSPVLLLEKTTPGPVRPGTRFREVVRMLPWFTDEIISKITRFEPPYHLEEEFRASGMRGHLTYEFREHGEGTLVIQRESLHYSGLFRLFEPLIKAVLLPRIEQRLVDIKRLLES
jgi:hypothetical protein